MRNTGSSILVPPLSSCKADGEHILTMIGAHCDDRGKIGLGTPITIRTREFITNRLLSRRQFIVDVFHPFRPNVSRAELSAKLAVAYSTEPSRVVLFGFRTDFGGQRSTGFGLVYDDEASQIKFEYRNRLVKVDFYYSSNLMYMTNFVCLVWSSTAHCAKKPSISITF
jgi:ribosomal protein S24E